MKSKILVLLLLGLTPTVSFSGEGQQQSIYEKVTLTETQKQEDCVVCFDNFHENSSALKLSCGHILHTTCMAEIVRTPETQNACPLCRRQVDNLEARLINMEDAVETGDMERIFGRQPESTGRRIIRVVLQTIAWFMNQQR